MPDRDPRQGSLPDRDPRQGSLPDRDPDPPSQRHDNLVHKQLPMWGGRMGGRRGGRRGGMRRGRRGGMRRGMRTENFSSRAAYSLGVHINWWISRGAQLVQTSRLASAGSNLTPRLSCSNRASAQTHASPQLCPAQSRGPMDITPISYSANLHPNST